MRFHAIPTKDKKSIAVLWFQSSCRHIQRLHFERVEKLDWRSASWVDVHRPYCDPGSTHFVFSFWWFPALHNHDYCKLLPFSAQPNRSVACPERGRHQHADLQNTVQRQTHIISSPLVSFFHWFTFLWAHSAVSTGHTNYVTNPRRRACLAEWPTSAPPQVVSPTVKWRRR